ncbi:hypothetical protein C2S53_001686 [Perilla frutescens var. hirtella]|uniref:Uncharacterized protein n=1 Tax=Perilla frutescens var. hirtella TaxID=608512 RepID=A0AAD4J3E5_PERFH|nr:hypothetical protein C2S53_001686 [Perilla frutescens var. hirtella]
MIIATIATPSPENQENGGALEIGNRNAAVHHRLRPRLRRRFRRAPPHHNLSPAVRLGLLLRRHFLAAGECAAAAAEAERPELAPLQDSSRQADQ